MQETFNKGYIQSLKGIGVQTIAWEFISHLRLLTQLYIVDWPSDCTSNSKRSSTILKYSPISDKTNFTIFSRAMVSMF